MSKIIKLGASVWFAIVVLVFWGVIGLLSPVLAPHSYSEVIASRSFAGFGQFGLLGTDYLGRDVLSRLMYGCSITLGLSFVATSLAFVFGVTLGFLAAATRGVVDEALGRINDIFLAFPSILLALVSISALGTSLVVLVSTVAFIESTRVFRIARSVALNICTMDFVEVALARGESKFWIMRNDVLPNSVVPLLTDFGMRFTFSILLLSAISFLGLGVQPPMADWGMMVRENLQGIHVGATALLIPAFAIFTITLAINLLVDWNLSSSHQDISDEVVG